MKLGASIIGAIADALPPSRGQELKLHAAHHHAVPAAVAPFTGAGIETVNERKIPIECSGVAPFTGAGIETIRITSLCLFASCCPLHGAGIETP